MNHVYLGAVAFGVTLIQAGHDVKVVSNPVGGASVRERFDDPRDYFAWFMDPEKADAYLAELAGVPS